MRIASWNVNSIRSRLQHVGDWIKRINPDILLLQELKCEEQVFPLLEFQALGYNVTIKGQKTYNGVAVISRHPVTLIHDQLPGDPSDSQARYLEVELFGSRIISLYLPNGNPIESEKFAYKIEWMQRLYQRAQELLKLELPIIFGGDFNIIPTASDVFDPKSFEKDALYHPISRGHFRRLLNLGYTDAYRALHSSQEHAYTYWGYQGNDFLYDKGLRIDHFLLSGEAVDRLTACEIDRDERSREKASDHTPIIMDIALNH